ncbi:hypothetical protein [Nocardia sp. 348MFTsu5.1]|uniref:hypothetical protein n=1 Tax=Nocardia sp. 348MFTsu5.1 TaxID=1172185 RepID=UPI00048D867F|nr:hypothetical protein [Nocardia sp. 348MFTsu5.1]
MSRNPNLTVPELSKEVIESLKAKGYTQTAIADMYGVTRQAVSWHLKTYGGQLSTRQIVNESWPWETKDFHGKAVAFRRLRDHGEFMRTGSKDMSLDKMKRLKSWWKRLRDENLVVEFDPNIPPMPGVSSTGGFAYRERTVEDDDLLIRVNEFTTITEQGKMIWCWPPDIDELI